MAHDRDCLYARHFDRDQHRVHKKRLRLTQTDRNSLSETQMMLGICKIYVLRDNQKN